jgi:phosphatidate cytidylyltransferase
MSKQLTTRIISALVAVVILFVMVYFFQLTGILWMSFFVAVIGSYEMARLIFSNHYPQFSKTLFVAIAMMSLSYFQYNLRIGHVYLLFPLSFSLVSALSIIFHKQFTKIEDIFNYVAKFVLGLMYAVFLPLMIMWILQAQDGTIWFLCLLTVVFAGDIGAYTFGTLFGKTKIAPLLSPKKSLQGSLGGLLFSTLAAGLFSLLLPAIPLLILLMLGLFGGLLGQIGDFFESLIKRIAGVKDSGSIMPGHGGVLDRLDGVYFASPLFFIVIYYII